MIGLLVMQKGADRVGPCVPCRGLLPGRDGRRYRGAETAAALRVVPRTGAGHQARRHRAGGQFSAGQFAVLRRYQSGCEVFLSVYQREYSAWSRAVQERGFADGQPGGVTSRGTNRNSASTMRGCLP